MPGSGICTSWHPRCGARTREHRIQRLDLQGRIKVRSACQRRALGRNESGPRNPSSPQGATDELPETARYPRGTLDEFPSNQIDRRSFSDDVARSEPGMSKQRAPSNSDFVAFVTFCSISSPNQTTWQRTVGVDCTQIKLDYGRDFTILHTDNFTIRPILEQLKCDVGTWLDFVKNFRERFRNEAGLPSSRQSFRETLQIRRHDSQLAP